jgi:putative restriction endonuclease
MSYCVFIHRTDSIYDDSPAEHYQFPPQYLGRAQSSINDWVVYLEPSKVSETRGYFAIARVQQIIPDPKAPGMHLAVIEPGTYLPLANPVPFNDGDGPIERGLLNQEGRMSGRAQSAVRPISATDFNAILEKGLKDSDALLPRLNIMPVVDGFDESQTPFVFEQPREIVQQLVSRTLRDRVFRHVVLRAYGERCAITGLKLINGGGRAEVNAAHIRPVAASGPDIVHNGIAMSGTAHWMFDRGLIGLSDDLEIMISRHVNDQESVKGFINRSGFAVPPQQARDRPHPRFLRWHRENSFKQ